MVLIRLCFPICVLLMAATVRGIRRIAEDCYAECTALYAPVCGSDGKTYNNDCELRELANCRRTPQLRKVKDRPCDVGTVVLLDTYDWDIHAPKVKIDRKSAITINIRAKIAKGSDSLSGRNLWRVGIFGSEWPDGFGDRYGYVEQILTNKHASKNIQKGKTLKMKNIRSRFDLSQIGCGPVAYFCVELARNEQSSVDYELRAGILLDSIVACERLNCTRPDVDVVPTNDLPPTCLQECPPPEEIGGAVCGNDSAQYDSFCEITKAARCRGVPVKIALPGPCPPEVIVSNLYWTAVARTDDDNHRTTLLDVEVYLFNVNKGVDVTGTDLWQVSLYGSADETGVSQERIANVEQALDRAQSSKHLQGGFPFLLNFTVPFDSYAVGCEEAPHFCLEIKRNNNASRNFVLKKASGETTTMISCRRVPCLPPPSDTVRLMFREVRWNVAADAFRFNAPSDISLNISVEVQDNSEAIADGRNLWRIGIYGSSDPSGLLGEKLNFIPQVLGESDSIHSPDIVPGRYLVFPLISTQFDISAIGCGEYRYLCVLIAKGPDAVPDFEITNNANKRKVVSCRQVQCISQEVLPPPPTTARLHYLNWNMTIASVRDDGAYNINVAVDIAPTADTDSVEGTDLWRIGIFLSNATSGVMARSQYQPDILTEEQKAIPLIQGQHLVFTGLEAILNVDGVGCPGTSLRYACMELAQGDAPDPFFVLPLGPTGMVHSCQELFCH